MGIKQGQHYKEAIIKRITPKPPSKSKNIMRMTAGSRADEKVKSGNKKVYFYDTSTKRGKRKMKRRMKKILSRGYSVGTQRAYNRKSWRKTLNKITGRRQPLLNRLGIN